MTTMKTELPSLSQSRLEDVLTQAASLNVSRQLGVYEIEFSVLQEEQSNTRSAGLTTLLSLLTFLSPSDLRWRSSPGLCRKATGRLRRWPRNWRRKICKFKISRDFWINPWLSSGRRTTTTPGASPPRPASRLVRVRRAARTNCTGSWPPWRLSALKYQMILGESWCRDLSENKF